MGIGVLPAGSGGAGVPSEVTPIDAFTLHQWKLNDVYPGAGPATGTLLDTGTAGASGNLVATNDTRLSWETPAMTCNGLTFPPRAWVGRPYAYGAGGLANRPANASAFSIHGWINFFGFASASANYGHIISRTFYGSPGYGWAPPFGTNIYASPFGGNLGAGKLLFQPVYTSGILSLASDVVLVPGWHHIAMTWDGSRFVRCYLDAALVQSNDAAGLNIDWGVDSGAWQLFNPFDANANNMFPGTLSDWRVETVERTQTYFASLVYAATLRTY